MLKRFFVVALSLLMSAPALAEETSTNLGIYLFAIAVEGDARVRNVNTEVDLGFDDIVENFDMGYMGYIEHRRGPWSFIGDLAYLRLAADDSSATARSRVSPVTAYSNEITTATSSASTCSSAPGISSSKPNWVARRRRSACPARAAAKKRKTGPTPCSR
jgi:hypothetical protein